MFNGLGNRDWGIGNRRVNPSVNPIRSESVQLLNNPLVRRQKE